MAATFFSYYSQTCFVPPRAMAEGGAVLVRSSGVRPPGGAPQWALDRAQSLVQPGEEILGVYVIPAANRSKAVKWPYLEDPCNWPVCIVCAPCTVCACLYVPEVFKSLVYVVTSRRLIKSIPSPTSNGRRFLEMCVHACEAVPRSYDVSGDVDILAIEDVTLELPGREAWCVGCMDSYQPTQVFVWMPHGHLLAGWVSQYDRDYGSSDGHIGSRTSTVHRPGNKMALYVDNPQEVLALIRRAQACASQAAASATAAAYSATPAVPVVMQTMERDGLADEPHATIGSGVQLARRIAKLEVLRDTGALTHDEFEEKKKVLLDKI